MDIFIPDKLYFKIGEVVSLTGVKAHVLRYWEAEFGSDFRPIKSRGRQRLYRKQDIELVLQLKSLLYREGYTIAGAKKVLRGSPCKETPVEGTLDNSQVLCLLQELRNDLIRLRKRLDD